MEVEKDIQEGGFPSLHAKIWHGNNSISATQPFQALSLPRPLASFCFRVFPHSAFVGCSQVGLREAPMDFSVQSPLPKHYTLPILWTLQLSAERVNDGLRDHR